MSHERDLACTVWVRSSYSDGSGGNCVEFSRALIPTDGIVPVRDSKAPHGPVLCLTPASWSAFVTAVRDERRSA